MKIRSLLLTVVLTTVALAIPAQAAGSLTLWVNDNYDKGSLTRVNKDSDFNNDPCSISNCGLYDVGGAYGDDFTSYKNNGSSWWKLYEDRQYGGYALCVRPYGRDADLGDSTKMDDKISSVYRFGTSQPRGCDKVVG
jgi:hypothetical protein